MYKEPKWVKSIPPAQGHGSGDLQKRLWRVVSDYVRIRDFYNYGTCVATGARITDWRNTDAGHYHSYSTCNGMFKFDIWNIHAQSKQSNAWGGQAIGYSFGEELKRRYGETFLDELKEENKKHINEKVDNELVLQEIIDILELMKSLPEQPDYFARVESKRNDEHLG